MNRFDKERITPFFRKWELVNEQIKVYYSVRDPEAVVLMEEAIQNYSALLEYGGKEVNERNGKSEHVLLPLNGEERFEFVKERINSHYAYVQLDALYTEIRKKAARLSVTNK